MPTVDDAVDAVDAAVDTVAPYNGREIFGVLLAAATTSEFTLAEDTSTVFPSADCKSAPAFCWDIAFQKRAVLVRYKLNKQLHINGHVVYEDQDPIEMRGLEHLQYLVPLGAAEQKETYAELLAAVNEHNAEDETTYAQFLALRLEKCGAFDLPSVLAKLSPMLTGLQQEERTEPAAESAGAEPEAAAAEAAQPGEDGPEAAAPEAGEEQEAEAAVAPAAPVAPVAPAKITTAQVRSWLLQTYQAPTRYSRQTEHKIYDFKRGMRRGLATVFPGIEVTSAQTLVFGGRNALLWGTEVKVLGTFYYYRRAKKPLLPVYVLCLDMGAMETDHAVSADVFAGCAAAAKAASANQFPELSDEDFASQFGWLRWAHTIEIDEFVAQAEMGDLHVKDDVSSSTLVFKHLLHSVPLEKLTKVLLSDITTLVNPNAQATVTTTTPRTLKPKQSTTRKSSRKRKPPQTLDMTQPASKRGRRVSKGGGRSRGGKAGAKVQGAKSTGEKGKKGKGRGRGRGRGRGKGGQSGGRVTRASKALEQSDTEQLFSDGEDGGGKDAELEQNVTHTAEAKDMPGTPTTLALERATEEIKELRELLLQQKKQVEVETPKEKALRVATETIKQLRQQMQQRLAPPGRLLQPASAGQSALSSSSASAEQSALSSSSQLGGQQFAQLGGQQFFARQPRNQRLNMLMAMAAGSPDFARGYLIAQQFPRM